MPAYTDADVQAALSVYLTGGGVRTEDRIRNVLDAVAASIAARAKAEALREVIEENAITIPDALGYKVRAVCVEDLLAFADEIERATP